MAASMAVEETIDVEERARILELEMRAAEITIKVLIRELTRAIDSPTIVGVMPLGGRLTVVSSSGFVKQLRGDVWVELAAVPGTRAEIACAALEDADGVIAGMAVVSG